MEHWFWFVSVSVNALEFRGEEPTHVTLAHQFFHTDESVHDGSLFNSASNR